MRIPISWLGEYVDLPENVTHEHVHAALVRVGLEEEDVHGFDVSGPIVVGQVLDFVDEPQSNGKTIRWCQVDVGEAEPRGIVCGAHNFSVGDKVVVSLPGAILPGPFPISARKTYGHVSDGMIASARELGLGDEHDGILRLTELGLDPVVGIDALHVLGLDDFAVEVNVTPDRGYAFSIRGIAREYSHSTGSAFRDPASLTTPIDASGFAVEIRDDAPVRGRIGATVFVVRAVDGIDPTRPTPAWMVSRLALSGIRSISIVVDITNYVMLELGQPIHAYDRDKVAGGIVVRRAAAGEQLTTLDGQTRALHVEDLLITDDSGPIGLAGVMGGASTEIGAESTSVLIEAANFDPTSIARTARRHKLPSEASRRFERGVDPAVARVAAARVVDLLVDLAGGTAVPTGATIATATETLPIDLPEGYVNGLIGADFTASEALSALTMIGASIEATSTGLRVTPPSWRPDLIDKPYLAEEVARIVGYDRIPSIIPVAPPGRGLTRTQRLRRAAAQALAAGGATEVLGYPFVSERNNTVFGSPTGEKVPAIALANPLDAEARWMRRSLIPGLIDTARRNLSRGLTDLALFEIGLAFLPEQGTQYGTDRVPGGTERPSAALLAELDHSIPPQRWTATALFLGNAVDKQPGRQAEPAGIGDALTAARQLAAAVGAEIDVERGEHSAMHPGRTARLSVAGISVGYAAELLPELALDADLPRVVAVLEVDLDELMNLAPREVVPSPISSFPAATQDLSLIVASEIPAGAVLATVREGAGELLEAVRLVDDYRGTGVPDARKSLTFALRFRATDRTLTAAEASASKLAAIALAASRFGATVRE